MARYIKTGPRISPSAYRRVEKPTYTVDMSIRDYLEKNKPLPLSIYPKTSEVIEQFLNIVSAKDNRTVLRNASTKGRKKPTDKEWTLAFYYLILLSNRDVPARQLMESLFEDDLEAIEDKDERKKCEKIFIDKINNYRHSLKNAFTFTDKEKNDGVLYNYILTHAHARVGNAPLWLSFDKKAIDIYKKAIDYWNTNQVVINGQKFNWDKVYAIYKTSSTKPNNIRFIAQLCKNKKLSRGSVELYLVLYANEDCFTDDDILEITNGQMNKKGFVELLHMMHFLSTK